MKPLIIAHRGASAHHHENTMAAFRAAVDQGADIIELDVRRTRDGVLVAHHDPGPPAIRLAELEAAGLAELSERIGYMIPTLAEVLALGSQGIRFDIELKETGYELETVDVILRHLDPDRFIITSFIDESIQRIKQEFPHLKAGLILGVDKPRYGPLTRFGELFPFRRAHRSNADVLAVSRYLLKFGFLRNVKRFKGHVYVWTVNAENDLQRLCNHPRVDGIITDDPALAARIRDGQ